MSLVNRNTNPQDNLHHLQSSVWARAQAIRLVIFDVDGVLTDGRLFFGDDGQEYKSFYARDGHGMRMLLESGVQIGIITGRTSQVVLHRMRNLGIQHVYQGRRDKLPAYFELRQHLGLSDDVIAYVGDDVMDIPVMRQVHLAITVPEAEPGVSQYAHWQTRRPGGFGAGRDVCDLIMQAQGTLQKALAQYGAMP